MFQTIGEFAESLFKSLIDGLNEAIGASPPEFTHSVDLSLLIDFQTMVIQDEMKVAEGELQEAGERMSRLEAEEQELKKEHIEVQHELDNYQGIVKENQQKIKYWKKEVRTAHWRGFILEPRNLEDRSVEMLPSLF